MVVTSKLFQSPIGWGLSCEGAAAAAAGGAAVSIPYWLGSKLRGGGLKGAEVASVEFQSPIGWGLSCESTGPKDQKMEGKSFNPLLVGV